MRSLHASGTLSEAKWAWARDKNNPLNYIIMIEKRAHNWATWFGGILVPAGLVFTYWSTIEGLVRQWLINQNYSSGLFVVPMVAYLVWLKSGELRNVDIKPDWRALPLLFYAIALFIIGELGAELFTTRFSMVVFILALTWFLCGAQVMKVLFFPLSFLFLMIPLPGLIYRTVTLPLQLFSSASAVNLLNTLNISAYREGNVVDIGVMQFQVAEACNGLRYILPLLTFGAFFAYLSQKVFWKRATLVMVTVPIAIFANVIRLAVTGIAANFWGSDAAEGFFHGSSALVVIIFCAGLLLLVNFLLSRLPGSPERDKTVKRPGTAQRGIGITWSASLTALFIVLATGPAVAYLAQVPARPSRQSLSAFPTMLLGWSGKTSEMEPKIWKRVGGQDYVLINYTNETEALINFYVAYYEYQRKGGDFIHTPRLCLVGGGLDIEQDRVRYLARDRDGRGSGTPLRINELVTAKERQHQLVYFWYQGRGRNFTSEYAAKFYMVWDGIWRRRTDGALVRLIMPLDRGMRVEDARRTLDPFALAASEKLEEFLPD